MYTFELNDRVVEINTEDDSEPKVGEMRPKEKYENTVIDMKEANSATLDVVYEIDLDIEELKSHNEALSNQFRDGLAAMLEKDWDKAKETFKKLPSKWIIAKKYSDFMAGQGVPDESWDGSIDIRK